MDHATYFPDQEENVKLFYQNPTSDQPIQINYRPTFFELYHTLREIKFLYGLNMNQNPSIQQLQDSATEACTSIGSQLHLFELGNEFNFAPGKYHAANYSLLDYVEEWNSKLAIVKSAVQKACSGSFPGFMATSFVLLDFIDDTTWTAEDLYNLGYDKDDLTKELCFHKYDIHSRSSSRSTLLTLGTAICVSMSLIYPLHSWISSVCLSASHQPSNADNDRDFDESHKNCAESRTADQARQEPCIPWPPLYA